MKISLKLQDQEQNQHRSNHLPPPSAPPLLLRAKLPVAIFNFPFISQLSTTTTHPSDLSLSLSTNFSSGPSLKLTYVTAATASASVATPPPLTLTMKSGTGLFGSHKNSPLVISAHFSFNPGNFNYPNPTFSLFFKPQLGSFSLRKSTFSHSESVVSSEPSNGSVGFESSSFDFEPLEKPGVVKDIVKDTKQSIFKGFELAAKTQIPLAKTAALNFRWTTKFVKDQMPSLRINKIGLEKIDVVPRDDDKKKGDVRGGDELELLKYMCSYMKRELDNLKGSNFEMKCELEKLKSGHSAGDPKDGNGKKRQPSVESSLLQKSNKSGRVCKGNGTADERKEDRRNGAAGNVVATDFENELQRAIKSAAST